MRASAGGSSVGRAMVLKNLRGPRFAKLLGLSRLIPKFSDETPWSGWLIVLNSAAGRSYEPADDIRVVRRKLRCAHDGAKRPITNVRRASVAAALAVLASACAQGSQSQPPTPPATASMTLAPVAVPPACPSPRAPTYLPWGASDGLHQDHGRHQRAALGRAAVLLRTRAPRRHGRVLRPSVTAAPRVIYGRETYLLWSGAPGASEISAWVGREAPAAATPTTRG